MKNKLIHFMQGRYGVDSYARFLLIASLILMLAANLTRSPIFSWIGLALLFYGYYRVFSRDISKRYRENQQYAKKKQVVLKKWNTMKKRWQQRKVYRFFKCPSCRQQIRVPRGKKKIRITCPACKTQFVKKT